MNIDYKVNELYKAAINEIISNKDVWKNICKLIGQLYRYEFDNILMVYMQKPNATLVADFDTWKKIGRYVKRGSKGIAIFSSKALSSSVRYVFDINDTGGREQELTWQLNQNNIKLYVDYIKEKSLFLQSNKEIMEEHTELFLKTFTKNRITDIMKTEFEDRIKEFINLIKTQEITAREAIEKSVIYAVFSRCGFTISSQEQDFSFITTYSKKAISYLGSLVSDISCNMLREILEDLKQIKLIQERSFYEKNNANLSRGGGRIAVSEPEISRGKQQDIAERGEIWNKGNGISERQSQTQISNAETIRDISRGAAQSGRRSESKDGYSNGRLSEKESTQKSRIYNGNVGTSRTSQTTSGRSRFTRNSNGVSLEQLQDTTSQKETKTMYSFEIKGEEGSQIQASFFDDIKASNFQIQEKEEKQTSGAKANYQRNLEAIKLLKRIEKEKRQATREEQSILSLYAGWGGIPQVFDETNQIWKKEYQELKSILNENEYSEARSSTNTAFFTSPIITKSIYAALTQFGFQKGSILEPALGIGNFFGALPDSSNYKLYGIEKDNISGRIAKLLYPKADIKIKGFEEVECPDNFYDVIVGNVPFGDYKLYDPKYEKHNFRIHDYFFAKALDKVRPGGIVAFITSKGTLDKANPSVRKYLAERAELIGAIRLPNTAFRNNAGTDVTSDIIYLQKRERKIVTEPDWIHLGYTEEKIAVNSYFIQHPEMMLGKMEYDNRMFGEKSKYATCINHEKDFNLKEALELATKRLVGKITDIEELLEKEEQTQDIIEADPDVKNYTYTFVDGNLYYRENSKMYRKKFNSNIEERIQWMNEIRRITRNLITIQMNGCSEKELKQQMQLLNDKYDDFRKKFGAIQTKINRKAFCDDADYPLLCSLEKVNKNGEIQKADMFYKQTICPKKVIKQVNTAAEALNISINEYGMVNLPFMLKIYKPYIKRLSEDSFPINEMEFYRNKLIQELKGLIYLDPTEYDENDLNVGWKTADEYLSGNVRNKLHIAKIYEEKRSDLFGINVEALQKVQPQDLDASEIDVHIGTTWIEPQDYEQFIYELLNTPPYKRAFHIGNSSSGIQIKLNPYNMNWFIENKYLDKDSVAAKEIFGTNRIDAYSIFEDTLNLRTITIRDSKKAEDGTINYVLNKEETMIAREKQDQMKEEFKNWIFKDPERRKKYVKYYNETFNNIRLREYDGSYLLFPGMNPDIKLRKYQKDAVARIILGGNTLLAHDVGAGKTYTMMAACMERKRLGLANKAVMVVLKSSIKQIANQLLNLYPAANILIATERDFTKNRRRQFITRIATGDYDCIVMSHSQFEKIPISKERREKLINIQIEQISKAIEEMKNKSGEHWTIKQMESQKKKLKEKLEKLSSEVRKDDIINFEELGIDSIMIDEAHNFKNLKIFSKINNVSGISSSGSQKATDLFLKCQYINKISNRKGIVFATGTPLSNTMCELYVMQLYLQIEELEYRGIQHFDAWAANFGEITTALELNVEGNGFHLKSKFNKFINLTELINILKKNVDIKTKEMLNLVIPGIKDGNYKIIESEPDWHTKQIMDEFIKRAEVIRNGRVDPSQDNFLKITHEARLLGTDARLLDKNAPNNPDSKLNQVVNHVTDEYFANNKDGKIGCQLIFSDIGVPKTKKEDSFDVYNYIKKELIKKGIPANEIAFIHDAKTDLQREKLFNDMRSGNKKILIGSTDKCGTGINIQDHIIAIHHVDCPWKPSSIEQREGRGLRQGNENNEVAIYRYVTKGTFDAYLWSIVENKQRFISQIMTSKSIIRTCEDIDEATLSYAEIKAIATGNPLIKEKMEIDNEIQRLNILKASYHRKKYNLQDHFLVYFPKLIKKGEEKINCMKEDIRVSEEKLKNPSPFIITIGNLDYTSRTEGGTAMLERISECNLGETTEIGSYKGFKLLVEKNFMSATQLILKGKADYKIELSNNCVGNIIKLENLFLSIPNHLEKLNETIKQYQRDMEESKKEYEKPFIYEIKLKEKIARQRELNIQLNLETEKVNIDFNHMNPMTDKKEINYPTTLAR